MSLTSIVCKICEKVIKKQYSDYLERKEIITQTIWIQKKKVNLLSSYSRVIDITQERDGQVDCIYLDLKEAFSKVPHMTTMEIGIRQRIERNIKKMDGRVPIRKGNENSSKG